MSRGRFVLRQAKIRNAAVQIGAVHNLHVFECHGVASVYRCQAQRERLNFLAQPVNLGKKLIVDGLLKIVKGFPDGREVARSRKRRKDTVAFIPPNRHGAETSVLRIDETKLLTRIEWHQLFSIA